MSAQGSVGTIVRSMFARSDDAYRGADLATSRRVTAALLGLSALLALAMLGFEPPEADRGVAGWAAALAIVAAGIAGVPLVLRHEPGFDGLLVLAYGGVAAVAALAWLAGSEASAFTQLFVMWVGAGAVHPPRRAFPFLAALLALLWGPALFGSPDAEELRMLGAVSLLILAIGVVLISYLYYIRLQRAGLQAGAEVARRLARVDALTGLGNRRALDDALTAQAADSARRGSPLSVALVDLDGLKRINDRFGHIEGDGCLRQAARAMEESLRATDLCYRWGGDEFVVLLPDTDSAGAELVLARMAEDVGHVCPKPGESGLTLSYGVAQLRDGDTPEDLLAMADLALMEGKTEKRR